MITTVSGVHPGMSFENGGLIGVHSLLIYWSFVVVNSACVMIRTHNEDMECNDCVRAVAGFISRLCSLTQSRCAGEDVPVRWLVKAECVWQPPRCLQWQHSRVHCSHFTHTNSMNTKILPADICTVLEDLTENYRRSVLQLFNAVWCYLWFLQPLMIISSVSLVNLAEVKRTQYIHV